MALTLRDMANRTELTVVRDRPVANLGFATHRFENMLTFAENRSYLRVVSSNDAVGAVLTTADLAPDVPEHLGLAICSQPRLTFALLHNRLVQDGFYWTDEPTMVDPGAAVHPTAVIAERNVRIEAGARIEANVTILERCTVGPGAGIAAGAVLGAAAFQTVSTGDGWLDMEHGGGLVVGPGVRVLAGTVVATGVFRHNTVLGEHARVGAQAFVSHAVQVGERVIIGHGAVINGNVVIGRDAWIGARAVIAQDLTVNTRAIVSLGAVVIRDVAEGVRVSGNFAMPHRQLLRAMAISGRSRG